MEDPIPFAASSSPDVMYYERAMKEPDSEKIEKTMIDEVEEYTNPVLRYTKHQGLTLWSRLFVVMKPFRFSRLRTTIEDQLLFDGGRPQRLL
jgi:hypothetical protein